MTYLPLFASVETGALEGLIDEYPLKILQAWWIRWPLGTVLLVWLFGKFLYRVTRFVTVSISSVMVFLRDPERPFPARLVEKERDYAAAAKSHEETLELFGTWPESTRQDVSLYWGEVDDETDMGRAGRYADQILARPRAYVGGGWTSTRWWAVWFALMSGKGQHAPLMCYAREFLNVLVGMLCVALVTTVLVLALVGVISFWWLLVAMTATVLIVWRRLRHLRRRPYQTDGET